MDVNICIRCRFDNEKNCVGRRKYIKFMRVCWSEGAGGGGNLELGETKHTKRLQEISIKTNVCNKSAFRCFQINLFYYRNIFQNKHDRFYYDLYLFRV